MFASSGHPVHSGLNRGLAKLLLMLWMEVEVGGGELSPPFSPCPAVLVSSSPLIPASSCPPVMSSSPPVLLSTCPCVLLSLCLSSYPCVLMSCPRVLQSSHPCVLLSCPLLLLSLCPTVLASSCLCVLLSSCPPVHLSSFLSLAAKVSAGHAGQDSAESLTPLCLCLPRPPSLPPSLPVFLNFLPSCPFGNLE